MSEESKIDPKHSTTRLVLRILGPTIAGFGVLFMAIGIGSFFSSFGTFEPPRYFWCFFVGIPLLGVGVAMCMFAFLGSFSRYISGEAAPVQKDTFNYLAHGTREGVKTLASAVGEGLAGGIGKEERVVKRCPSCDHENDSDAKFCKNCGSSLVQQE
jgi:zinc-ribbon domain